MQVKRIESKFSWREKRKCKKEECRVRITDLMERSPVRLCYLIDFHGIELDSPTGDSHDKGSDLYFRLERNGNILTRGYAGFGSNTRAYLSKSKAEDFLKRLEDFLKGV